ncbi:MULTISPECIES: GTP cyclohydrolase I [Pseudonocardiaceae]|uniref:GTP cyclohydrolase 1 n=1 Tax=Lentzea guizhouensis TaxID=1586287 RepID=A0A1B2HE54_9PSEU|nr:MULTISPECIES: GTP cyclohydrolase I [Pseudonocardiaceae]ANZ36007.1 GTP cyclohydrolase [Lentzea guizhouensis]OKI19205.1 GTP cyclohydrolase [Saccharothrix sp. CB00851]
MTNTLDRPAPSGSQDLASPGLVDTERVADLVGQLLAAIGEDPGREGLSDTPARVAAWWLSFLSPQPSATPTCFPEQHLSGQLVVIGGMSVWSLCEHHLLPMNLDVAVGYVPDGEVMGLSKFGRIAQQYAGRLQVQERFTREVANEIAAVLGSNDVAVAVRGTHLCMSARGVRMEAARTTTVQSGGRFESDPVLSQQFLTLATDRWRTA